MHTEATQPLIDEEHLRLLRIGYLISGALNVFFVLFPLIYVAMGLFVMLLPAQGKGETPPFFFGLILAIFGGLISLVMAAVTTLKFLTARAIQQRRRRTLCLVTAGICCFGMPYGTALGVATFIVLMRPSVAALFTTS